MNPTPSSSSMTPHNIHHTANNSGGGSSSTPITSIGGGGNNNGVFPFLMSSNSNSSYSNSNTNNNCTKNGQQQQGVVVTNSGQFHSLSSINSIHLTQNLPQQTPLSPRITNNSNHREQLQLTAALHTSTVFSPSSVTEKTHDGDNSSIFNGSASSTVLSKSAFNTVVNKVKNHFMSFTLFMQDNEKKQSKMDRIMMFGMYMYMIWVGIWISTLSPYDYHYGEWGSWFFAVVLCGCFPVVSNEFCHVHLYRLQVDQYGRVFSNLLYTNDSE
ncbi:predicted protein [Naegleria gruberi]|uniref:Predicted protein n=1 Tax=Naegleria gruberi TaxID=5762 RepID=D2VIN0_NAEGR|nr:uncharacterized protein NAEGRDRAFT_68735 [Naegleria gruberi]EFC43301.1 predicted protein [Naegleria gruberi]|eukprot:XP_002676045.1 predicted protein [Naegleria gruberi strain NEG-M]